MLQTACIFILVSLLLFTASRPYLRPNYCLIWWILGLQPSYKSDHSAPYIENVKNMWSSSSTPTCAFMAWSFRKYTGRL